jgi:hypothetical protein
MNKRLRIAQTILAIYGLDEDSNIYYDNLLDSQAESGLHELQPQPFQTPLQPTAPVQPLRPIAPEDMWQFEETKEFTE